MKTGSKSFAGVWSRFVVVAVLAGASGFAVAEPSAANDAVAKVFAAFEQPGQPGCSVGARRDGAVVHASGHGLADIAAGQKLTEQSVFNIASISKQFTAFSILLLDERKALSIDDPLTKHVPELAASANGVTLRHLLHHIGGLRDYEGLLMLRGRRLVDGATQAETIRTLARQRSANFPAGTKYAYSNSGYVLLATVVERVSGQSMKQFAAQNIFTPLGMTRTSIVDRYPADIAALARGYAPAKQGFDIDESAWEQVGDGQVHTTVGDLLLWTDNFSSGRVGGAALVKRMTEVGVLASGEKIEYAAGLVVAEHHGLRMVGHGGGWAGYRSNLLMFPEQRFAVAVFCNRGDVNPGELARSVAEVFLAEEMRRTGKRTPDDEPYDDKPPKAEWQPKKLAAYKGVYLSDEAEARCLIVQRNDALVLEGCAPGLKLQPAARGEFFASDMQMRLRFGESGAPSGFTLHAYALDGLAFTKQ